MDGWISDAGKYLAGGGATMVLSAAVRALPAPNPDGPALYGFFYRFVQNMMANFDKAQISRDQLRLRKPNPE